MQQDEKQALKSCVDKILQATQMAAVVDPQEAQSTKDEDVTAFLEKHAEERRRQSEVCYNDPFIHHLPQIVYGKDPYEYHVPMDDM